MHTEELWSLAWGVHGPPLGLSLPTILSLCPRLATSRLDSHKLPCPHPTPCTRPGHGPLPAACSQRHQASAHGRAPSCRARGGLPWGCCCGSARKAATLQPCGFQVGICNLRFQRPLSLLHCPSQLTPPGLRTVSESTVAGINCFCYREKTIHFFSTKCI